MAFSADAGTHKYAQGDAAHGVYKVNSLVLNDDIDPLDGRAQLHSRWPGRFLRLKRPPMRELRVLTFRLP